jgi:signal transduction histidine kinase
VSRLIVIKGVDEGKQFELSGDVLGIGREASNRIKLHDTEISRRHAEFLLTPEGYRLRDVGSANGTSVNNQGIQDVLLRSGDQIQVGRSVLVYSAGTGEDPSGTDLAQRIHFLTRRDEEFQGSIVRAVGEAEGSRILAHPDRAEGPWLKSALANLSVMYEAIQAVSHILDVDNLLERIMDLIFRSLDADCGCVMLRAGSPIPTALAGSPGGVAVLAADLEPKAVRWRAGVRQQGKVPISRTVVEHVLTHKQGVLVSDAARDERFKSAQSLVRMGVREIICVPMKGRHETLGVLYLDTHTTARADTGSAVHVLDEPDAPSIKFTGDHLSLASAIAHQAALAIEETRYHQALIQAERLAAIGQTVAVLSHHIKNILQGLKSGGDLLEMGLQGMDKPLLAQGWKLMQKNQAKIYDLVNDMLSYSKEREPHLTEMDISPILREVVDLLTPRAADLGVALKFEPNPRLPRCHVDPEGIHRAVLNVVGNALDAVADRIAAEENGMGPADPPGLVTVTAAPEPASEPGNRLWVRILVRDNGSGIPPEKVEEIFHPFVSTKGSAGTGLGLPVSRKILREHGGDLLVESQPGRGSTFVLRIPLRTAASSDDIRLAQETLPPSE